MRDMADIEAFLLVARARGFREASRIGGRSSSSLSDAVKRLETDLGLRLLNRTTRSVLPTEAGRILIERLGRPLPRSDQRLTRRPVTAIVLLDL